MRTIAVFLILTAGWAAWAADVESNVLKHYVPQDFLETAVRKEGWSEVVLNVKGGIRKGDIVRVWSGGSIDRGNGDQPGQNVAGPHGPASGGPMAPADRLALSPEADHAYALLVKSDSSAVKKCAPPGKPLEVKLTKDGEKFWLGFNDERGRYLDNHLGKGRRHELDPLWVRIEVVRIVVD
jgi:hypothetical protein